MKALVLTDFETAPVIADLERPEPDAGQIRIRVKAAGLNRMDAAISSGMVKGMAEYQFPVVLGRDAAGIVDAVGAGVDHVSVGDEVIGHIFFGPTLRDGTLAEYALLPADGVVAKPASLDFTQAAAVPLACTAALAAVEAAAVQQGQRVLIAGAGGGVGSFAVQLRAALECSDLYRLSYFARSDQLELRLFWNVPGGRLSSLLVTTTVLRLTRQRP
jgi:NADPH:quinone reductase-like Zn-dependent oxidoreductase